ncbi:Ankyrin repeat and SOCS box protein 6 [Merluccius polli]|uniref:Ankyrin repeat and SOCS box protein 6 n=1 Tax=Merluccius polli TaxID=89951 RepID=A0AA47N8D8_MERPO|nr:Ankyrin repeat and SOCS box protein 6 [Merluccius polli]
MPFLHGFRRIVFEYQPLVDAILLTVGLEEGASCLEEKLSFNRGARLVDQDTVCSSLVDLLERESKSPVFEAGISYALFKVAERGLVYAAEILLRYGANLNFEDPVSYYNPLHIAILRGRPSMVRLLAGHGADIEKRDRIHESSPLDLASEESDRLACMHALLDLGADVNAQDKLGKTALLHTLACIDGLTVHNTENIQLLLQRGADVHAATKVGESTASSLVFLIKDALDNSSNEDAAQIGRFCVRACELLLAHGMDASRCLVEDGEPSLTQASLEHFDLLLPLAVLLLHRGAAFVCSRHRNCWSGHTLLFQRLRSVLQPPDGSVVDESRASEILEQAEFVLEAARVNHPSLPLPPGLAAPVPGDDPGTRGLLELHRRVVEQEASPPALRCLCRAFLRRHLQPWPLVNKIKALPLPDRLKDFLLPENTQSLKPSWESFRTLHGTKLS